MIKTAHLTLIACELPHFEAILSDQNQLAQMLGITVFKDWFHFPDVASTEAIRYSYEYLKANPDVFGWWTYLFIHVSDQALVGIGGYKGKADAAGMVEIGYAIIPEYRGRGLATEAAQGLIDHAFSHAQITRVDAHTLAEKNASTSVLRKIGMEHVGIAHDPDVGEVWHWSVSKEAYQKA